MGQQRLFSDVFLFVWLSHGYTYTYYMITLTQNPAVIQAVHIGIQNDRNFWY